MKCANCHQINGQQVCPQCYSNIKNLNQQKLKAIETNRAKLEHQISKHEIQTKTFESKMEQMNRKAVLVQKIKKMQQQNEQLRSKIIKKKQRDLQIKKQMEIQRSSLQKIKEKKNRLRSQIKFHVQNIKQLQQEKQKQKKIVIKHLNDKFNIILSYISMDLIDPCKLHDWNQFVNQQSDSIEEQDEEEGRFSEQMNLFMQMEKQAQFKMASHFVRSIKAINVLALIHQIQLPYLVDHTVFRQGPALQQLVFDQQKSKFHLPFLRLHQANTIYLYSRACIIVHHPEVEAGRLQQLHQVLVNRIKGHSLSPISRQFRKPTALLQLQYQNLCQIKQRQRQRSLKLWQQQTNLKQQQQLLLQQINEHLGFKQINSDQQDEIQLLV